MWSLGTSSFINFSKFWAQGHPPKYFWTWAQAHSEFRICIGTHHLHSMWDCMRSTSIFSSFAIICWMQLFEDVSWRRCQLGMPVESASCWRCHAVCHQEKCIGLSRRHSGRSSSPQTVSCVPCSIVRTCVQSGSLLFSRQMQITPTSLLQIKTRAHCRAEPFFCTSPSCHFVVVEISFHHYSEIKCIHTAVISWVNSGAAVYTTGNFNWQLHFEPKKILQLFPARIANCHTWVGNT